MFRSRALRGTLMFLVLFAAGAAADSSALRPSSQDSDPITAIGSFTAGRLGESHSFGYEAQLWRAADRIVGFFIVSSGTAMEPPVGVLDTVTYNLKTGEIEFDTELPRDLGETCQHFHFAGRLLPNELVGTLAWTAPPRQGPVPSVELLRLIRTKTSLSSFPTYREWKQNADDQLKSHGACR
jgi:hypothetical protein